MLLLFGFVTLGWCFHLCALFGCRLLFGVLLLFTYNFAPFGCAVQQATYCNAVCVLFFGSHFLAKRLKLKE